MTGNTERVESRKTEKILTFIKVMIGIIIAIPLIIVLKNFEHVGSLRLSHFTQIFLGLFLLISFHSKFSKRKGQFIEWAPNQIQFKTREQEGVIQVDEIENIHIDIDFITINLKSGMKYTLDIQDFGDYEIRLKIKDNFSRLKKVSV